MGLTHDRAHSASSHTCKPIRSGKLPIASTLPERPAWKLETQSQGEGIWQGTATTGLNEPRRFPLGNVPSTGKQSQQQVSAALGRVSLAHALKLCALGRSSAAPRAVCSSGEPCKHDHVYGVLAKQEAFNTGFHCALH